MARRTTIRLSDAIDEYQRFRASDVGEHALYNDGVILRQMGRALGMEKHVHIAATQTSVEQYMVGEKRRLAPSSFNKSRLRVTGFFTYAQRKG